MNKRQIKKFCKKGGRFHFDKTISRMSKKMMYPFVANTYGHMISWCKMGTCITCDHCTDVTVDWNGTPYMCYGSKIGCGGAANFTCKRYKLDPDIKFFKYKKINTESPDCELKRYIDQTIKELQECERKEREEWRKNREEMKPFMDAESEKILAYLERKAMVEGDVFVNLSPETEQKWIDGIKDNDEEENNNDKKDT